MVNKAQLKYAELSEQIRLSTDSKEKLRLHKKQIALLNKLDLPEPKNPYRVRKFYNHIRVMNAIDPDSTWKYRRKVIEFREIDLLRDLFSRVEVETLNLAMLEQYDIRQIYESKKNFLLIKYFHRNEVVYNKIMLAIFRKFISREEEVRMKEIRPIIQLMRIKGGEDIKLYSNLKRPGAAEYNVLVKGYNELRKVWRKSQGVNK